jgi:hypothetical protein
VGLAALVLGLGAQDARAASPRAPSKPPLTSGPTTGGGEEEASAAGMSSAGDPLVSNGLGSPLCRAGAVEGDLSQASQSNCQTSGFEAAPAPTGDYAFDVHINTGATKWTNDAAATFQDLLQLGWTVLEAAVHGVIVMLEWCYTLDLLNGPAMSGVARGLRAAQATFTQPWLVLVLAVASVLALYHGLVRRQVAETIGQALMMGAMMVGGLWVIVNPAGTIGALGGWANQAALGTLGAVTAGTPAHPDRTLADSMRDVFSGAVEGPWCYMEFGNVGWCSDPARLDPRLRASGLAIAALEQAQIGCGGNTGSIAFGGLTLCAAPGSAQAKTIEHSVELLHGARTNGDLFLALPANQGARNSINSSGTLFNVLCGGSEEPCKGPTAAQAEFRTEHGTGWRFIGLFFIWVGLLGMILTLGFIGLRLLAAAIGSLLYLLLAPAAVLAPALGDGGRAAFRGWATRLLGAVMSKLIYSFLLGVVLLMARILTVDLTALGWFTQWLLVSVMWWGVFLQRHQLLSFAQGAQGQQRERQSLARRVSRALETPSAIKRGAGRAKGKLSSRASSVEERRKLAEAGLKQAKGIADGQVTRTLEREHGEALALVQAAPQTEARISDKRAQLEQMQGEHATARAEAEEAKRARESALSDRKVHSYSDRKLAADRFGAEEEAHGQRAADLQGHTNRLQGEIAGDQGSLAAARRTVQSSEQVKGVTGSVFTRAQAEKRARFLDAQAALPAGERDYAGAAGLAGYGRREYEALDAGGQQAARREIDQELAVRKGANVAAREVAAGGDGSLKWREQQKVDKQFGRTLEQEVKAEGHELPASLKPRPKRPDFDAHLQDWRAAGESSVMRDAREVATRRKRQLGREPRR